MTRVSLVLADEKLTSDAQEPSLPQLGFLSRLELYQDVKPYGLRFSPPDELPQTNIKGHLERVRVQDARLRDENASFETCGFCLVPFSTAMAYRDFNDPPTVKDVYCSEIAAALRSFLDVRHVRVIDFSVSDP